MNLKEIKAEIEKRERQLQNADPEQKSFIEKKIAKLKEDYEYAEIQEAEKFAKKDMEKEYGIKPKKKEPKKEIKSVMPKLPKKIIVKENQKRQTLSDDVELIKLNNETYSLIVDGKNAFDFIKKGKKWFVECKVNERSKEGFTTLPQAVKYVVEFVYKDKLKEFIAEKKEKAKNNKKWQEEHPEGQTKPKEDIEKASDKIVKKVEEKSNKEESVNSDFIAVFSVFKNKVVSQFKTLLVKNEIKITEREKASKEIDSLIKELIKLKKSIV